MSKLKLTKIAKIKFLVLVVLICEFSVLSPFKAHTVNAQEITGYLSTTKQQVAVNSLNANIVNKPQPLTPAEIAEAKIKAEEEARIAKELERAQLIDSYLSTKKSPLVGFGKKLVELEKKYGVSANLIVAISGVESSFCQINFRPYNCWGWFTGKVFTSYNDSLEQYANYISSFYIARGYDTPAKMAAVYCPPSWQSWLGKVNHFMSKMSF